MIGMVMGAVVLGGMALGVVQSRAAKSGGADLSGTWRLDAAKSELPGRGGFRADRGPGGGGGWGGRGGGGGWGGRRSGGGSPDGNSGDSGMREGRRGRRLPDLVHVTQQGGVVAFQDSTGTLVQEIRVDGSTAAGSPTDDVAELTGHWDNGTLVAERTGPRGGTMVQKYTIEDHGRTLEIHVEMKASPDGGSGDAPRRFAGREIKLVYRRSG
jgi:hypothetical protein